MRMRPILCCLFLLTPCVVAQREETDVEWQKRHAKIEYNAVPVGKHKIDDLQTGGSWRMGEDSPSVMKTEMPIMVGDQIVVPGAYRVGVNRPGEKEFAFMIEAGTQGEAPQASPAGVFAKGELKKPAAPTKKLEVTLKPDAKATTPVQPAKVTVTFGENQLVSPLSLIGVTSKKAGAWTIDAFSLPADLVEKRLGENKPIPVLAFKKESGDKKKPFHVWNLVVTKDSGEAWLAPAGPTDAFTGAAGLSAASMAKATSVKWEEAKDSKPFLELTKAEVAKGKGATIVLQAGKQICTLSIPEPKLE